MASLRLTGDFGGTPQVRLKPPQGRSAGRGAVRRSDPPEWGPRGTLKRDPPPTRAETRRVARIGRSRGLRLPSRGEAPTVPACQVSADGARSATLDRIALARSSAGSGVRTSERRSAQPRFSTGAQPAGSPRSRQSSSFQAARRIRSSLAASCWAPSYLGCEAAGRSSRFPPRLRPFPSSSSSDPSPPRRCTALARSHA